MPGAPPRELPVVVPVHPFLPASFLTFFSTIAPSQGSPVEFMLRRTGTLRQTSLGSPLSISPKLRLVFPREAACKGIMLLSCSVGRTLSPLQHSGFLCLILPSTPVTINIAGFYIIIIDQLGLLDYFEKLYKTLLLEQWRLYNLSSLLEFSLPNFCQVCKHQSASKSREDWATTTIIDWTQSISVSQDCFFGEPLLSY